MVATRAGHPDRDPPRHPARHHLRAAVAGRPAASARGRGRDPRRYRRLGAPSGRRGRRSRRRAGGRAGVPRRRRVRPRAVRDRRHAPALGRGPEPDPGGRSGVRAVLAWATFVTAGPRAALRSLEDTAGQGEEIGPDNIQVIAVRGCLKVIDGQLGAGLADLGTALGYAREGWPIVIGRRAWAYTRWAWFLAGRWEGSVLSPADARRDAGAYVAWYDLS